MDKFFNLSTFSNYILETTNNYYDSNIIMKRDETFNISQYDIENNKALGKCLNVLSNDDEWKYLFGIGQELGRYIMFGINITFLIYIFITQILFIKNIKQFMISIRGPSFCIMTSIGCFILILSSTLRRFLMFSMPCIFSTYSFNLGVSLISIGVIGYNYNIINHYNKYMDYINNSILDFIYVEKKQNIAISKLHKFNQYIINHVYRVISIILFILIAYSLLISFIKVNGNYKFYEKGLCFNKNELIPFIILFVLFHIFFSGLLIYRHTIVQHSKEISINFRIIIFSIFIIGFVVFSFIPQAYCKTYYITSDSFLILYALAIHFLAITKKVYLCYYSKNKKKNLKPSFNGLLELLSDKYLANEFTEFCRSDYCIENMMFFKEFWRYKHNYRSYFKAKSINNTEETLNDEKTQIQSRNSYFDSQNISLKNPKFFSIRKLFKSTESTLNNSKKPDMANSSYTEMPKEIQPCAYFSVNMPRDTYIMSIDNASVADNVSIKKNEINSNDNSRKGDFVDEEFSQKGRKKDVDYEGSTKEDVESIKNLPNEKNLKTNSVMDSYDSNLSECSRTLPKLAIKRENSSNDQKNVIRALRIIEEDNYATTSNPDYHIDDYDRYSKNHGNSICNGSFDNHYEEFPMKRRLLENLNCNNINSKSDRTLSKIDKHVYSNNDVKMLSANSMAINRTMCNVNQVDCTENHTDGNIIKTSTLKRESQSYSSPMDFIETKIMLDSDRFKNIGYEKNIYDKKQANIKLHNYAQEIFDKYLCPGSAYELNISNKTVKKISDAMSNTKSDQLFSENIFNQAYIEVLRNLYLTSFQKFLNYDKRKINNNNSNSLKKDSQSQVYSDDDDYNYKDFDF